MKLDILAIGVHPDDIELSCVGTILKHIDLGYTVGALDLTRGELGTRGTPELRRKEALVSAEIIGLKVREALDIGDGFFHNDKENVLQIINAIRAYQPDIIFANAIEDRHPDHGKAATLVQEACFLSGLRRVETTRDGKLQDKWRPKAIYHYIQDYHLKPDFVVDISPYIEKKMEAIYAFGSQFYDPNNKEPASPISGKDFMEFVKAKGRVFGRDIGAEYAEGFNVKRVIGVEDMMQLK